MGGFNVIIHMVWVKYCLLFLLFTPSVLSFFEKNLFLPSFVLTVFAVFHFILYFVVFHVILYLYYIGLVLLLCFVFIMVAVTKICWIPIQFKPLRRQLYSCKVLSLTKFILCNYKEDLQVKIFVNGIIYTFVILN